MELQNFRTSEHQNNKVFIENAEDLEVFKVAYEVSLEIVRMVSDFPKYEQYDLASQMRRASRSICSNIAEGFNKQGDYPLEFKRFLSIAIGSTGEMKLWLKYSFDLGYIQKDTSEKLRGEYDKIKKMLGKLREKIKS